VSQRVVSLVPSVTETLDAWGITPIAVTRFCERPDLPAVGGTKDPEVDVVISLAPDLVVMCDEENRREDAATLIDAGLRVHVVTIESVDDVAPQLTRLADAVEVTPSGFDLPARVESRKRAFIPIWRRPWRTMNGATYGSSVLEHLGISNVFADEPTRYPETTLEAAAAFEPDVVLAPSEPYPFTERFRSELEHVAPVVFVDGQDLFWWGARTAAALRRLDATLGG
jgi:ABC-type Fe3+-hydroxamate transport system substrate-binding protein